MSESGAQSDYFLHLDLGEGDIDSQVHADGNGFLDFTESSLSDQENQQASHALEQESPHQWAGVAMDITKDTPLADPSAAEPAFAGLIAGERQSPLDASGNPWDSTEVHPQSYGSLMDMEIQQQMTPPEQNSGYITPDLIFAPSASRTALVAPESESQSEPATAATQKADSQIPVMSSSADITTTPGKTSDGTTRSRRSSGSQVVKESPAPAPTPVGDVRRSGRSRKPTALAALSEEYVHSTQVSPLTTTAAVHTPERVTRSKKVYCYCQKPDDGEVMIQCDSCRQW